MGISDSNLQKRCCIIPLENGFLLKGRYRILDILGQGSLGVVYRAVDEKLDINVVIKEHVCFSENDASQFQSQARVLASLRHPNLEQVLDYFLIEGQAQYLVGEYIEGGTLGQWMARTEGITEMEALQIGIAVCNALSYLHSHQPPIIHCGIKPENIKFTEYGEVILVDLGLMKNHPLNTDGAPECWKPAHGFSPPEQFGQGSPDQRTDIFSLGATLYTALAGYSPENSLDRVTGKAQLSSLRSYLPHLSRQTVAAIEKALNVRFDDRWQSADAFKQALINARQALPEEKQRVTRLVSLDQSTLRSQKSPRGDPQENKNSFSGWVDRIKRVYQRDPVWFFYGAIILLLVVLFGFSLLRPQGLRTLLFDRVDTPQIENGSQDPPGEPMTVTRDADSRLASTSFPSTALPLQKPEPTPLGGGAGRIAFVSDRSGIFQIWLVDVTSKEVTQLTDLEDGACQPDWSPTGDQIVFTSPCTANRVDYPGARLMLIDISSGVLTPLPASLEGDYDPVWSPDGEWIAYTTLVNGRAQLAKLHLKEQTPIRLSDGKYPDSSPAWSPDGTQLAFTRVRGVTQIWLMDADGDNQVQFTLSGQIDDSNPAWHTAGDLILFSQSLGPGSPSKQLFGMRLEDIGKTEEYAVIPRMRLDYIPLMDHVDVSPDGFWLAFDYRYFDVLADIYLMSFPGSNLLQLTDHPGLDYDPAWSPLP